MEKGRAPGRPPDSGPRAGFTLIELMIALVLLTVGVMATAQVFAVANQHTSHAREETAGVCLAQEIREKIMSEAFDDIRSIFNGIDTNVPASVPTPAATWAAHVASELGPRGRGRVSVSTPTQDATIPNGMIAVTVTMSWREGARTVLLPLRFNVAKTSP
jgi:prepilin-type N-terminal cleavage/methylation domain-containing protein